MGGVAMPEIAVPLGTFTGWNVTVPPLPGLRYLAGLVGAFVPFAPTREARMGSGDPRPSVAERYRNRDDFLRQVDRASRALIEQRFLLAPDAGLVRERAAAVWTAVVGP
jgi:hypothetical protein